MNGPGHVSATAPVRDGNTRCTAAPEDEEGRAEHEGFQGVVASEQNVVEREGEEVGAAGFGGDASAGKEGREEEERGTH